MLPQTNAILRSVADVSASADYDYDGGAAAPVWTGEADAYLSEEKRLVEAGGALNRVSADTLLIDEIEYVPQVGQRVTFEDEHGTQTREITTVAERPRLPGVLNTTKLYLKDQ